VRFLAIGTYHVAPVVQRSRRTLRYAASIAPFLLPCLEQREVRTGNIAQSCPKEHETWSLRSILSLASVCQPPYFVSITYSRLPGMKIADVEEVATQDTWCQSPRDSCLGGI